MKSLKQFLNENIKSEYLKKIDDFSENGRKIFLSEIMKVDSRYGNKLPAGIRNKYSFDESATLSLSELIATQTSVEVEPIKDILKNFNPKKVNVKVIFDNGKYYVVDGHHTLAAIKILDINRKIHVKIHKSL